MTGNKVMTWQAMEPSRQEQTVADRSRQELWQGWDRVAMMWVGPTGHCWRQQDQYGGQQPAEQQPSSRHQVKAEPSQTDLHGKFKGKNCSHNKYCLHWSKGLNESQTARLQETESWYCQLFLWLQSADRLSLLSGLTSFLPGAPHQSFNTLRQDPPPN